MRDTGVHAGGSVRDGRKRLVIEWLNSPGHRQVMLSHRYRRAGAGKAVGWIGGRKSTIWVVRFAS